MSRTIIITGATGKFGKILVKNFLNLGDIVIAIGRSKKQLDQLKIYKTKKNQNLFLFNVDIVKKNSILKVIKMIKKFRLKPDSLINSARNKNYLILAKNGRTSSANFLNEFKLGVVVPYQLTMSLIDAFPDKLKNIVNIGSIYGSVATNKNQYKNFYKKSPIKYGVAKSDVEQLTKELSVRLAKKLVRVNCAAFGGVEGRENRTFKKRYAQLCPSEKMLSEDEIFGPIEMLVSNKTSGVTGHVLIVDGGWNEK